MGGCTETEESRPKTIHFPREDGGGRKIESCFVRAKPLNESMESTASKQLTAFRESFMAGVDEKGNARRLSKDSKCFSRYAI